MSKKKKKKRTKSSKKNKQSNPSPKEGAKASKAESGPAKGASGESDSGESEGSDSGGSSPSEVSGPQSKATPAYVNPYPEEATLVWTGRFAGGFFDDVKRRLPKYVSDYTDGLKSKVLASTLFLFFACLANAIAFGALTGALTGNQIGTIEMLIITAVGGVAFALFSGQPLTILGGTGPIVIFTALLFQACTMLKLNFLATYAWVGIWSGFFMVALALTDSSALMRFFTRFTDEIFAALISVIFIVEAVKDVVLTMQGKNVPNDKALLTLVLALGTYLLATNLKRFGQTPFLKGKIREAIADFGPSIAIAIMTGFAVLYSSVPLSSPKVPSTFSTTSGRPWLVDLTAVPVWVMIAAAGPALLATVLLFLDQNITTRLVNATSHRLKKGPGYHLDLLVVGLIIGIGSLFALPWIVAATVHSLNHVKSLANTEVDESTGQARERIVSVIENRISPLAIHVLIGVSLYYLHLIQLIPMSVLFGLFLYMGFASLRGNDFWERVKLWFTEPALYPKTHYVRTVPNHVIHKFTLIQLMALVALWILKTSKVGILFPLLIAMLVPLRLMMPRWFDEKHLEALDAEEEPEEHEHDMLT